MKEEKIRKRYATGLRLSNLFHVSIADWFTGMTVPLLTMLAQKQE